MANKAPNDPSLHIAFDDDKLFLTRDSKTKIFVDFAEGANAHRQKFGGGKNQAIAKAVGLNKVDLSKSSLKVFDATAGMGKDAFVLASLGCEVTLVERQQPIYALLVDGFRRAKTSTHLPWFEERMSLIHAPAQQALTQAISNKQDVDVVYLDPMFPHREKSAAVKKDMALFQTFVGTDDDADELLPSAITLAKKRVVVKRPDYAPFLNTQQPSTQIKTKKNRFDVYVNAAMV
ncbi:class I SAM-dependent methyltransferase [Psychrosphaera sp. F3M07]|uniref:class I SAM-dependent methyltransferase n=1 Tax=Psychrosphaera sp. F3M07 TaxID=2841560 RepID=UPI001C08A74F|nr:class I SAM-dependent methyltransferase [Psychrosphaera sp. F3M07]